jgi:[ribosomal protein S5]-alanine N-acetyltransferase
MVKLETSRLTIRDVVASDAECFLRYVQKEHYLRYVPLDPPTRSSIVAMVDRCIQNQDQTPRLDYFMAAVHKRSGEVIGEAILHVRSRRWRQGEIGWGVDSTHAGQGLATEIGDAMLRFAFATLDLHRVFAQCRVENQASRRIMAKLGMSEEGVLRENVFARGEWWSSAQSSILSGNWSTTAKAR